MMAIKTLLDHAAGSAGLLENDLSTLYDGNLAFPDAPVDRPYVISNFVSSLDGVLSYAIHGHASGAEIGGFNDADRFIMALLRATADAIIVGATTAAVENKRPLTAEALYPETSAAFTHLRKRLGKSAFPLSVVLAGDGKVDFSHPMFHTPGVQALILATNTGSHGLEEVVDLKRTRVIAMGPGHAIQPGHILQMLYQEWDVRLCLHEGGPESMDHFLDAGLVDELFLTFSPRIAGQGPHHPRPSLGRAVCYGPENSPQLTLKSLKQQGSYLFTRYTVG